MSSTYKTRLNGYYFPGSYWDPKQQQPASGQQQGSAINIVMAPVPYLSVPAIFYYTLNNQ